ncbi:hypothetical protein LC653_42250 [Nostoc sp. CHAB 5784]|nr:hypothetical protein [Nostoc mirabile CHAB5784]
MIADDCTPPRGIVSDRFAKKIKSEVDNLAHCTLISITGSYGLMIPH